MSVAALADRYDAENAKRALRVAARKTHAGERLGSGFVSRSFAACGIYLPSVEVSQLEPSCAACRRCLRLPPIVEARRRASGG